VVKADSKENHYLNIYDITSSKKIQTLHLQCQAECYAFSNDRRLLAVATRNPLSYCESIEPIYGEEYELACYSQPTGNCYIYICDLQTLSILACLEGHQGAVTSLVFTEDDSKIVSSSNDCSIAIWDTKNYKKLSMLLGHSEVVHDMLLSDDDSGIISCSWDGTIRIWDMASLDCCSVIYAHSQNIVGMPVCENHEYFATLALDGVKIWSVKDLECICSFDPVSQLEFIDGGDYVLASRNGDICMYDLPSGECVMVYEDVGNAFDYNKFNRMVAAAGENGIFLFRIEPLQELIDRAREKYEGRQFTVEERNEYFLENR
jgi:F-box/WD-40 domain protein 7